MLKPLRLKKDEYEPDILPYVGDCQRLQRVLAENGYEATIRQCYDLWTEYSDSFAAGWLQMPEEDSWLFSDVRNLIVE